MDSGQKAGVVADVLDNIEQAHRRKSLRRHSSVLQGGPHDLSYPSLHGVSNTGKPRFHQNHVQPGVLNRPRNVTVPAANVKQRSRRWKELDRLENAAISVTKPKRPVFDGIA